MADDDKKTEKRQEALDYHEFPKPGSWRSGRPSR